MKRLFFVSLLTISLFVLLAPTAMADDEATVDAKQEEIRAIPWLKWRVAWGTPGWNDTSWYAEAHPAINLLATTYYRLLLPHSLLVFVTSTGDARTFAGPPSAYEVNGFQLGRPEASSSFAGMNWRSGSCLPGPTVEMNWYHRGFNGKPATVVKITNTTKAVLYYKHQGSWKPLQPGHTYHQRGTAGEISLIADPALPWSQCVSAWWR